MPYVLNVCYILLLLLASPWLLKGAMRKGKYREGYGAKLFGLVPRRTSTNKCLWFHAVSVGEVNLLAPLLKQIQAEHPDWECVISTTTTTGMTLAKKKYAQHTVFYCPLDFTWATTAAMRRVRPDLLVLAELELWPNLIRAAKKHGASVAIINGRLSEKSHRGYRKIRWFMKRLFQKIDAVAVQDETYAQRFRELGAADPRVTVTGSMKYDGAETRRDNPKTRHLAQLAGIDENDLVFLAGSTQDPEETAALHIFQRLADEFPRLKLILVPRHPDRFNEVASALDRSGMAWQRRSTLSEPTPTNPSRILLVDVVGELGAWWGTAQFAFVGGSFGQRGGQNMIEPAAYGAAVSFGPNTWNFRDIVASLLEQQAAVVVNNPLELEQFLRHALTHPSFAAELGQRAQAFVLSQQGATAKTLRVFEATLNELPF